MLSLMAQRLSFFFVLKGLIREDEKEIYDYCFEILLSTVANSIIIITLSILNHAVIDTCWFMMGFIMIRITAGGFHADTHIRCMLLLIGVYIGYTFIIDRIVNGDYIVIIMCICSWISVTLLSPVEDINKHLSKKEIERFRCISNILIIVVIITIFILMYYVKNKRWK